MINRKLNNLFLFLLIIVLPFVDKINVKVYIYIMYSFSFCVKDVYIFDNFSNFLIFGGALNVTKASTGSDYANLKK